MAPKLHLYLSPGSCAMASHIILQDSGLPYSTTEINLRTSGFPADKLHLNPKGKVPFLEYDGEIVTEGIAIVNAIASLVPEKKLLGNSILETARVLEWVSYLGTTVHSQGYGMIFGPARFTDDASQHDAVKQKGRELVKKCYEYIDGKLEGKNFAVGNAFTVADAYLLTFYSWGILMQFGMKENFSNYTRLVEEALKRDSVKIVLEQEGVAKLFSA
jgi:glutathione S-transferase